MKTMRIPVCVLALVLCGAAHAQGDPAAGRDKAETCMGCHAISGYTTQYPSYNVPKLGGQHAEYIVSALEAYKSGKREHATMHANASTLSEQDMQDIAAYLEQAGGVSGTDEPRGEAPDGVQQCTACHGPDGNSQSAQFPRIAGQYQSYLAATLRQYKSGERQNATMNGMAGNLSPEQIEALAAFYARQQGLNVIDY